MDHAHSLHSRLWREPGLKPWVALDGAGVADLLPRLHHPAAPRWACLFHGRLEPGVAALAPYLLEVPRQGPWRDWLLSGWGSHWGVYLQAPEAMDLASVRRHLRKLAIAYGPAGESLLFRWYDPRVLRLAAPGLEARQLQALFGPLRGFLFEGAAPGQGLALELAGGALTMSRF
ncbi:DUF4123 domain-containing protein [Malikia sp.]|uniref:DUF4123 domain-containing protein n=1 Tax=Malikia sp. TaxID=2070706 RepID=UPI002607D0B6|nr:DUF4123 domain-containing protein [Malikia sp.]MDD2728814.1 DUF4123 domain-containing protein [Malikia sp.]